MVLDMIRKNSKIDLNLSTSIITIFSAD